MQHNFCSRECFAKFETGKQRGENKIAVQCAYCGKEKFIFPSRKHDGQYFCDSDCNGKYKSQQGRVVKVCEVCGKQYSVSKFFTVFRQTRYCSRACKDKGISQRYKDDGNPIWVPKETLTCKECGAEFEINPSDKKFGRQFCSETCAYKHHSKTYRRERHWLWQGGKIRDYGPDWSKIASQVRRRDNWACVLCGKCQSEMPLHVHHIIPLRKFNGDFTKANQLSNLVTLCEKCHVPVERGKKKIPQEILERISR